MQAVEGVQKLLKDPSVQGFNITIPFKTDVLQYADEQSLEVEQIGACNTFKRLSSSKWKAYNTDVFGFSESIKPLLRNRKKALVLGYGGAAKAVGYALEELGVNLLFVSRNPAGHSQIAYSELNKQILEENLIIINTTPLGTFPNVEASPNVPYAFLTPHHLVFDLVYNPEETAFLKKAKLAGCQLKNGLEMLHLQAQKAWTLWGLPI